MSMTRKEKASKWWIIKKLSKEGYVTYARLLENFDLNITDDPNVVAYMEPGKGRIVINSELDEDQVSVACRHEILHQFLEHEKRLLDNLAKKFNIPPENMDDLTIKQLKNILYKDKNFNIAADYEISNRAYTDKDKEAIRNINLGGRILSGLVTEDKHPEWVDWSVEQMYDELTKDEDEDEDDQDQNDDLGNSDDDNDGSDSEQSDNNQQSGGNSSSGDESGDSSDEDQNDQSGDGSNDDSNDQENDSDNGESGGSNSSNDQESDDDNSDSSGSNSSGSASDGGDDQESDSSDSSSGEQGDSGQSGSGRSGLDKETQDKLDKALKRSKKGSKNQDKTPDIGDKGSSEIQDKEEEERKKQIEKERQEAEENGQDYDEESEEELKDRLDRIKKMTDDQEAADALASEDDEKVAADKARAKAKEIKKYNAQPSVKFENDLSRFIKKQVTDDRDRTWKVFNKNTIGSGIITRGYARTPNKHIPKINVYYDQSGSWSEQDVEVGNNMLGVLNQYVRKNQIAVDIYYFANHIETDAKKARSQGGTGAGQELINHIKSSNPDNVIVMTDQDFDWYNFPNNSVTVPGAVWFLWKGGSVSNWLKSNLKGSRETNSYNI